jgi:hypothetical protein
MNSTTYFADVTITEDRQYSRSYGSPIDVKYAFATVNGNWINLFDDCGSNYGKKMLSAKHLHEYTGTEITERTFNMRTKKNLTAFLAERKAEKDAEEKKAEETMLYIAKLADELEGKILDARLRILEFLTLDSDHQTFNKAVGCIGYKYAKHLGWYNVVSKMKEIIF